MTSTKILRRVGVVVGSMALFSLGAGVAAAQESADSLDTTTSIEGTGEYRAGDGFKISEDLILRPRLELEAGYQPNVFREDDSETPVGSPLLRIGTGAVLGTMNRETMEDPSVAPKVVLNADVMLIWHQYISDNKDVTDQSDLGVNFLAGVEVNPKGSVIFDVHDGFVREVNPPPEETTRSLDRDKNDLSATLTFKPGGGALDLYLKAMWTVDIFEAKEADFADRNSLTGAMGARWQWLPKTQVNGEVSFGIVSSNSPVKPAGDSLPLRILVGTSTLITPNFGTVLKVGYGNGFYDNANYSNFLALAELRYAVSETLRVAGGYRRDFEDSLIGSYRADDAFYARFSAQFVGRVLLGGKAQVSLRKYDGLPTTGSTIFCNTPACPAMPSSTRDDTILSISAHLDFQTTQWLTLGALYTLYSDTTDAVTFTMGSSAPDSVGYVWQEFMVRALAQF